MDVYVFTNIYNHWVRDDVLNFENVIYGLFRPEDFDGVIITAEAFFDISVIDSAAEKSARPVSRRQLSAGISKAL